MRTLLVAELATSHGGNVDLAADMIRAAADAGADMAKLQSYSRASINPEDPQAAWLLQSHLDKGAHETLLKVGEQCGIEVFSTPFCAESLQMLRELGLKRFKVASSEARSRWWDPRQGEEWIVSLPWGRPMAFGARNQFIPYKLTAIPLYPTPLECVGQAEIVGRPERGGWSDHCMGLSACLRAIGIGVEMVEAHMCLPNRSRIKAFDKSPEEIRRLRDFAEDCATMQSGVGQTFRERWKRA